MATADEIEKIVIDLESRGADSAYVAVSRVNGALTDMGKQRGPVGVLEGFNALQDSLSRSLVDLPNMASLTEQAARAWHQLAGAVDRYGQAQANKSERNSAVEAARTDARQLAEAMQRANRIPTELQQAPPSIDWAGALAAQSQKAGSAIEAASHSALEEAAAIGEAAMQAQKLASVYDLVKKRAAEAAKADQRSLAEQMNLSAFRMPSSLKMPPIKLSGGQKLVQGVGKLFGPKGVEGLTKGVEMLDKIGPIASKVAGPMLAIGGAAIAAGAALGGAAAMAAQSFGEQVIEAQAYREDVLTAFQTVRRTQGDAAKIMAQANALSDRLGVKRAEGAGRFLDVLSKTQDPRKTELIIASLADLSSIDPSASIEGLTRTVGKIQAMGKMSQDAITELSTSGLEAGDVYAALAKQIGKTVPEVQKMLGSGKIDSTTGIDAVIAAIKSQTGTVNAGDAAAKKANNNLSSLLQRARDIPENMLFDINAGPGIGQVKDVLREVLDFMGPASKEGQLLRKSLGDAFNGLIEGLTGAKTGDKKGLSEFLLTLNVYAMLAADGAKGLGKAIRWTVTMGVGAIGTFGLLVNAITSIPEAIGEAWDGITSGASGITTSITSALASIGAAIKGAATGAFNAAWSLGSSITSGIAAGIKGTISAVTGAGSSVAASAIGGTAKGLDSHSPSREYAYLGEMSTAGMVNALYAGQREVRGAGLALASSSLLGAGMAAGQANGNGGAGIVAMSPATGTGAAPVIQMSLTIQMGTPKNEGQAEAFGAAAARAARPEFEAMAGAALRRLGYG